VDKTPVTITAYTASIVVNLLSAFTCFGVVPHKTKTIKSNKANELPVYREVNRKQMGSSQTLLDGAHATVIM